MAWGSARRWEVAEESLPRADADAERESGPTAAAEAGEPAVAPAGLMSVYSEASEGCRRTPSREA